jgi:hypothetical protein
MSGRVRRAASTSVERPSPDHSPPSFASAPPAARTRVHRSSVVRPVARKRRPTSTNPGPDGPRTTGSLDQAIFRQDRPLKTSSAPLRTGAWRTTASGRPALLARKTRPPRSSRPLSEGVTRTASERGTGGGAPGMQAGSTSPGRVAVGLTGRIEDSPTRLRGRGLRRSSSRRRCRDLCTFALSRWAKMPLYPAQPPTPRGKARPVAHQHAE